MYTHVCVLDTTSLDYLSGPLDLPAMPSLISIASLFFSKWWKSCRTPLALGDSNTESFDPGIAPPSSTQDPDQHYRPRGLWTPHDSPHPSPPPYSEIAQSASDPGGTGTNSQNPPVHFPGHQSSINACSTQATIHPDENLLTHRGNPYPTEEVDPFLASSHDLYTRIRDNLQLLSIFGVAIVFHDPPSVLQISRVLGLRWADITAALKPVSSYLDTFVSVVDHSSEVKLRSNVKNLLLRRAGSLWIDAEKYHSLVARWCLVGKKSLDARDITYRADFWALSNLPLDPLSRLKLAEIIYWLEENEGPSDLLTAYRMQHSKPPEQVDIMGGMLSMFFWLVFNRKSLIALIFSPQMYR
ncbi:hypothetical protein B0H16DRAFT_1725501 [Mycena metata]|uniref:Uncharacterized protein n=1 Tax=Mycena metata TaxID=1033252 RepID=A0AAD7ISX3_9AGAR|nr:hypothetical protein B0H16DRAFT_1725501 [Mycena metata]